MTILKSLISLCAIAILSTGWCLFAAEEDNVVEITETEIKFGDCPAAVQKSLQQESVGARLQEVIKVTEADKTIFKAYVTFDERDYEIVVAGDGMLLAKVLNYENEITIEVNLSDCPPAVQKTLKREARGTEIKSVEKVVTEDKLFYLTDIKIDGKTYQIIVGEDAILISKLLNEEDETNETSEKQDKKT